jgi:hypothetical protein
VEKTKSPQQKFEKKPRATTLSAIENYIRPRGLGSPSSPTSPTVCCREKFLLGAESDREQGKSQEAMEGNGRCSMQEQEEDFTGGWLDC